MRRSYLVSIPRHHRTYNLPLGGGTVVSYPARVALEVHMSYNVNTIEMKQRRDQLIVTSIGRTPNGVKYRKQSLVLKAKSTSDPEFKTQLAAAVNELAARSDRPLE